MGVRTQPARPTPHESAPPTQCGATSAGQSPSEFHHQDIAIHIFSMRRVLRRSCRASPYGKRCKQGSNMQWAHLGSTHVPLCLYSDPCCCKDRVSSSASSRTEWYLQTAERPTGAHCYPSEAHH